MSWRRSSARGERAEYLGHGVSTIALPRDGCSHGGA
jgi:hypothetical protein